MTPIRTVLCPVDFTPLSHRALQLAVAMCKRLAARLVLHHNLESRPPSYLSVSWMWSEDHEAGEEKKAAGVPKRLKELFAEIPPGIDYEAKLTRGPIEEGLLFLARRLPADLLIMGTHGRSSPEHRSLTERIVLRSPCTVLTTGESYDPEAVFAALKEQRPESLSVLVPVDFTARSRLALDFALALAHGMPHRIHLVHVRSGRPEAEAKAEERLRGLVPEVLSERVTTEVTGGHPVEEVLEAARRERALFILMAAHGQSLLKRHLFGDTTLGILHGSECPVWFVPPRARKPVAPLAPPPSAKESSG